jgi:hypothetical protein
MTPNAAETGRLVLRGMARGELVENVALREHYIKKKGMDIGTEGKVGNRKSR